MKLNIVLKATLLILFFGIFFSCSDKNQFTVKGIISGGNEKMLYFENVTTSRAILLDSVKLNKSGSYKFTHKQPEAPDFYRLRLNNQLINFSADSTEIITINSDTLNFAKAYTVEGSADSETIKTLSLLQLKTSDVYNQLQKQYNSQSITADEYLEKINISIDEYKEAAKNYIFVNPASASAYFAIFQQVNGLLIFDPYDKNDSKIYGAVANNWNQYYPEAQRTKHLVQLFANSLAVLRGDQTKDLDINTVDSKDFFDISLLSYDNKSYRLSEVGENKVVLLEFISYSLKESPLHNIELANVYRKYYDKGFQIYQVSLDTDQHFWKNAASNLPWVCVLDPESVYSNIVKKYNVRELPTGFILNKKGEIASRIEDYAKLETYILPYLN